MREVLNLVVSPTTEGFFKSGGISNNIGSVREVLNLVVSPTTEEV